VTGPAPGGTERGTDAPSRVTGTQGAVGAILVILALGLAFRLIIAYLLPGSGFGADLNAFRFWASNLASEGLHGFYERDFFHDYTPGYLYVLWLVGIVGERLGGIGDLIKIPPIIADLAIGWLVWSMAIELGARQRLALLGAAVAVANPISWFDSVVWGQVDSFGVVFLLLGLRALWRDRPERAAIWTVVAAIIKPQLGILVPLVAVVTIRRALRPAGGHGGDPAPSAPALDGPAWLDRLRAWEHRTANPLRIGTTGLAGFLTAVVLCLPFGLSVLEIRSEPPYLWSGLLEQVGVAAGGYQYVSVNAYNPWALIGSDLGASLAGTGQWVCDVDAGPAVCGAGVALIAGIPAVLIGTALLLASIAFVLWFVARRPDRLTLLVGLAVLAIIFFVVPTRVHERYMFPFFALGAILFAISWRWRIAYVVASIATFANMYVVLTTIYPDNPSVEDWLGIGPAIRSPAGVTLFSILHLLTLLWAFLQFRAAGRAELEAELADSSIEPTRPGPPEAPLAMAHPMAATTRDGSPAGVPRPPAPDEERSRRVPTMPVWRGVPPLAEVGFFEWIRARMAARPIRPDRSRGLTREPGGRFDRLDVWLLALLIVATLGLRTFRLAEPYQMHFDEVYHARTGTEFLQAWRYGDSHDIYEWTHPHLAKYAMAAGIVAWGDDRVSATSELGGPVHDALAEARRDDALAPGGRAGERLYVATGDGVVVHSLRTRDRIADVSVPGASALGLDDVGRTLFVGTSTGSIVEIDVSVLDIVADGGLVSPRAVAETGGPIDRLLVTDDGATIVVASGDRLTVVERDSGSLLGSLDLPGLADFVTAGSGPAIMATPVLIDDPAAVAERLAELTGGDPDDYEARLSRGTGTVVLGAPGDGDGDRDALDTAISEGELPGIEIVDLPHLAVADGDGLTFIEPATLSVVSTMPLTGGAHGLALVTGIDDPKLYVTSGTADAPTYTVVAVGGDRARNGPAFLSTNPMPGLGGWIVQNGATQQVHALGVAPDGSGSTVYVIEPHANAVYADARLPFEPSALALDVAAGYPAQDRQQLLVFSETGGAATVEVGKHAFAWRLPGVIAGALSAALLFLLARILFRRRSVALLAGFFALADGMLFAQSRIAMNDVYVGFFILAAYAVFAALWTGRWRHPSAFWLAMPVIGVLLGLALAAKWVALYAIGALVLLLLARSALGRVLLILGMIAITAVLGFLAVSVPEGGGIGNLTFLLVMIGLTLAAVIITIAHPIAWSDDELRLAVVGPAGLGALVFLGTLAVGRLDDEVALAGMSVRPIEAAFALALGSLVSYAAFRFAGRWGFGPLAATPGPDDVRRILEPPAPAARGWLRPGSLLGLPLAWAAVCLVAIPLGVYVASYIPWALVENHRLVDGWPPGHAGQSLIDLTGQMYRYHDQLTAAHAASSPWWAWPFDLKPVWFYQQGFASGTAAAIYGSGNLVIWWLGVPAMAFAAWMAFRRRSLALALIVIAFAAQWVPWARIDRAAFQYHYYTALPFVILALAYFIAELWHGASRRTWFLARLAAGAAIFAPAALWILSRPLCWFVSVESVNPGSQACPALIPDFVLTARAAGLVVVFGLGLLFVIRGFLALDAADDGRPRGFRGLGSLAITAALVAVGLVVAGILPDVAVIRLSSVPVEPIAMIVAIPLGYLALQAAGARDARRFVGGVIVAVVVTFAVFYPNISALPLPSTVVNAYQGIIPTYLYAFQFPVNTVARNVDTTFLSPWFLALVVGLVVTCLAVAHSAWTWRVALARGSLHGDGDAVDTSVRGG
jgi:Gpi18-like mannosyltransferase